MAVPQDQKVQDPKVQDKVLEGTLVGIDQNARVLTLKADDNEVQFSYNDQTQLVMPESDGKPAVVRQGAKMRVHFKGFVLSQNSPWFAAHFDKKTAELLQSAYQESMKNFEATTRRLYEADVQHGAIEIHINGYPDPKTAPVCELRRRSGVSEYSERSATPRASRRRV